MMQRMKEEEVQHRTEETDAEKERRGSIACSKENSPAENNEDEAVLNWFANKIKAQTTVNQFYKKRKRKGMCSDLPGSL